MRVNEIFYSLQGEGYNSGKAAIFIRLSGCNLKCPFCDTDFAAYKEMTVDEIVDEVVVLSDKAKLVVLTGGEPTLQDCKPLVASLHLKGYTVAMESNGTQAFKLEFVDWLTISPKEAFVGNPGAVKMKRCDELKVVFDGIHEPSTYDVFALHYYLQPCDTGDEAKNKEIMSKCVEYIKQNPKWKLSLQTQKILNVR